jgi:hypothetical protein
MKDELKQNIMWICGIILLTLAAVLFLSESEIISILPGFTTRPHIAAITLTISGVILITRGQVNHIKR